MSVDRALDLFQVNLAVKMLGAPVVLALAISAVYLPQLLPTG